MTEQTTTPSAPTPARLSWSEPLPKGWAVIRADDGEARWSITPVPGDVARIGYAHPSVKPGALDIASAESAEEAMIVIDALRAGTDHLADWRVQLEEAGFARTYPNADPAERISALWNDGRTSGHLQIVVTTPDIGHGGTTFRETSVAATYESGTSDFWHNLTRVNGPGSDHGLIQTAALPAGVDPLKAGVAAALAVIAARKARGGRFATPIGGATKRKR